ncbi:hypothetical protein HK19_16190 [Acetobacter persici]|nr:hypothetical protein HK19_16190 [Acetobacter persici]
MDGHQHGASLYLIVIQQEPLLTDFLRHTQSLTDQRTVPMAVIPCIHQEMGTVKVSGYRAVLRMRILKALAKTLN